VSEYRMQKVLGQINATQDVNTVGSHWYQTLV
jgi:hypothetical protein